LTSGGGEEWLKKWGMRTIRQIRDDKGIAPQQNPDSQYRQIEVRNNYSSFFIFFRFLVRI
jgi:hypothetical protein